MDSPKRTRKELRGAIIGMAMGDGSLTQCRLRNGDFSGNYRLYVGHAEKQYDYLCDKRDIVSEMFDCDIPVTRKVVTHRSTGKSYPAARFQTRASSRLTFIAKRMYVDRKKRITPWVLQNITLEGLAMWWMDDGCLRIKPKSGGEVIWGLYGFPKADVQTFQEALAANLGVHLRMRQNSKMRRRNPEYGWYLSRGLSEGRKLLDPLTQYCLSGMDYKFDYSRGLKSRAPYSLSQTLSTAPAP